jgi:hypothetical protein
MQFSPTCCHLIPLQSKHFSEHPVLKHSLFSSLDIRDQVSHPYKSTSRIIVHHISIYIFVYSRREKKNKNKMVEIVTGMIRGQQQWSHITRTYNLREFNHACSSPFSPTLNKSSGRFLAPCLSA